MPRLLNLAGNLWNSQVFASNIYIISKEIEVIKICKTAKEGSKFVNELLNEAIVYNILGSNAQR